jgi:THO complex subunit 3
LVPISVNSPSLTNGSTAPGGVSTTGAYKALASHKQSVQTNGSTFSHSLQSDDLDLFLTTGDGTVKIVSYPDFKVLHTLHAHTAACLSIALSPTARYLAVGGGDALISLWDTNDWVCKRTVSSANGGGVRGVSWSWDGRFIVGACDEPDFGGGLEIFHAETGDSVYTISTGGSGGGGLGNGPGSGLGVPAVAWHPSRYCLAYSVYGDALPPSSTGLRIIGAGAGIY